MTELQQDLDTTPPQEEIHPLHEVTSGIVLLLMKNRLDSGKGIEIPSLGLVITPAREVVDKSSLTPQERAKLLSPR